MPTQAQLDAQNNASRFRVQQPHVDPYGGQYGTGSTQDQGYYDEEEMTEEEWAAYLAGLERLSVLPGDGVYDQFDAGVGQLAVGSPMGSLIESLPGANSFYNPLAAGMGKMQASIQERENAIAFGENAQTPQAAAPAPQGEMSPMVRAMLEDRLARTNADIVASGGTPPSLDAAPEEPSFLGSLAQGFRDQNERMAQSAYSPMGGVSTPSTATQNTSGIGASVVSNFSDEAIKGRMGIGGDPFGVTQEEIAASGNQNFGQAGPQPEAPYRTQYGIDSLSQSTVNEIQQQNAASPQTQALQAQAPQGLTTAGGQPLAEFLAGGQQLDAQGRMIDPNVDRSNFENESALREQRAAESFGKVRGPGSRDGDTGDGAPTALFKKEAEAAGLSGRAKAEFISERSRAWTESKEDRETAKASGRAAAGRSDAELAIKVSAENRELTEDEKKNGIELSSAAGALNSLRADLDLVREKGGEIIKLSQKSFTEGILGKAISKISPTSSAAQLERASGVLTGDAFIKGMQVIKEFGGGLGSVTEVEGLKVERAQGAIFESGMSGAERRSAVNNYIEVRENAYNRIHSQFVKQYGAEEAAKYLGDSGGNVGQARQTGSRHADDQDHGPKVDTYYQG